MSATARKRRSAWDVANRHYTHGQSMEEIAAELGVSRSTISRHLQYARDIGFVEIRVVPDPDRATALERQLAKRWGVRATVAAPPIDAEGADPLEAVAAAAAATIAESVAPESIVGVAWGATVEAVGRHLPQHPVPGSTMVQLNGAGNFHTSGVQYASELMRRFGDSFGARVEQFPIPAFFDSTATRDALWKERSTRRILSLHRRLDLAVFGIGSPFAGPPGHVYQGGYLERDDYLQLRAESVVGDVATIFYRADGSTEGIGLNDRSSGPPFSVLKRARHRICVASGDEKAPALAGALEAGIVTHLVLDPSLAAAVLRIRR